MSAYWGISDQPRRSREVRKVPEADLGDPATRVSKLSLSDLRDLERRRSRQVQRGLNATFQDLLRLGSVGHRPRELEGAHHEAENGGRAAAARCGIRVGKQCGKSRDVASEPFLVVLPRGQGLSSDFGEQRRRGAPARPVFDVSAVQVPPNRALKVETSPLIFVEAKLLGAERARQHLANEFVFGLKVRRECPLVRPASPMIPAIPAAEMPSRRTHFDATSTMCRRVAAL